MALVSRLTDTELVAEVKRLVRCEREATANLISHLAEFDARRLYLGAGCSSLFTYCTEVLRLSEHGAYGRIEAARAGRRFPRVLRMRGEGRLTLTTVRLLASHLSDDNHAALLAAASDKSKREVEELIARHSPQPPVPCSIRRLPAATKMIAATSRQRRPPRRARPQRIHPARRERSWRSRRPARS
jgi:hypothetical protein